jgi:DNA mismatch repair protein MSH2
LQPFFFIEFPADYEQSLIIQLGAKECVIQDNPENKNPELKKISDLIDRCGIAITANKPSHFSAQDIEQDLSRLMASEGTTGILPFTEHKVAMGAASAIIRYLSLMADELNFGQYKLYQHDLSQYMRLDASAVRALNLMPGPRDGSKNMSLYGLLNKCKTAIGTRLLGQWLKQPLMSLEEIERRHSLVEAFVEDTELRQTMQEEHLKKIPDLYRLSKRFKRKIANLEDVVRAYQVVITLPGFIGTLEAVMDEKYKDPLDEQYTNKLREISTSLEKLQELVETTVDLDAIDEHEFKIKPEFNEDFQNISQRLEDLRGEMKKEHRRASKDLGQEMDKKLFMENHKTHGFCFRLTRNEAACIRNSREYKEIMTQKNGVYFTTNSLRDLNREFDQATQAYDRMQRGLVGEVVQVAGRFNSEILSFAASNFL